MSTNKNEQNFSEFRSLGLINNQKVDVRTLFQKLTKAKAPNDIKCVSQSNMQLILLLSPSKSPNHSTNSHFGNTFIPSSPKISTPKQQSYNGTLAKGFLFGSRLNERASSHRKLDSTLNSIFQSNQKLSTRSSFKEPSIVAQSLDLNSPKETKLLNIKGIFQPHSPKRQPKGTNNFHSPKHLNNTAISPKTILLNYRPSPKTSFLQPQNKKQSKTQLSNIVQESLKNFGQRKLPKVCHPVG